MKLDDLHDALLKTITIDLEAGCITLVLGPVQDPDSPERVVLVIRQFEQLVVPRRQPWGLVRTWCVNEVRESLPTHLEIEMQSGDTIEIHGGSHERIDKHKTAD